MTKLKKSKIKVRSISSRILIVDEQHKGTGLKYFNDSKVFIEYSRNKKISVFSLNLEKFKPGKTLNLDTFHTVKECNPGKKCKTFIVFTDMNADMLSNKNVNPIVTVSIITI